MLFSLKKWVAHRVAQVLSTPDGNGPLESRRLFPVLRQVEKNCRDKIEITVVKLKLP